ncbi:polyphenol oxidase family protein [Psychrobacter sp. CAL346-MNA-CIBAN-0220]|uniref:polyphenol oxidase family protein n=1 Tax=Psychrobacter sp. CAL346-MNA-CIBAN-0220 TaxID=3140457 RepID=UPI00332CFD97
MNRLPILLPMTVLAQLDEVTVYQTAAFQTIDLQAADFDTDTVKKTKQKHQKTSQQLLQSGQASYGELNLGLHVNDDAAKVLDNRMRLLAAINQPLNAQQSKPQHLPINSLHWVNQVHGKQICDVDTANLSMRPMDADAIVSQQAGLGLAIMTADCVPIVLYQPASGKIAAIHAGWQGLACAVIKATVERFTASGPIMAWIGTCISQNCYEVSTHVRDQLLAGCLANKSLSSTHVDNFDSLFCMPTDTNTSLNSDLQTANESLYKTSDKLPSRATVDSAKIKLDLPKLAAYQLRDAGITVCSEAPYQCSYTDERYYSYRRQTHLQQPATGRMALIIVRSSALTDINYAEKFLAC